MPGSSLGECKQQSARGCCGLLIMLTWYATTTTTLSTTEALDHSCPLSATLPSCCGQTYCTLCAPWKCNRCKAVMYAATLLYNNCKDFTAHHMPQGYCKAQALVGWSLKRRSSTALLPFHLRPDTGSRSTAAAHCYSPVTPMQSIAALLQLVLACMVVPAVVSSSSSSNNGNSRVAIIGAGMGGAFAAHSLSELSASAGAAPIDVDVFEASTFIGGRAHSFDLNGTVS